MSVRVCMRGSVCVCVKGECACASVYAFVCVVRVCMWICMYVQLGIDICEYVYKRFLMLVREFS